MWRKTRWLAIPAFLAAVLFMAPDDSWGQPPGGFGGRGGFGKGGGPGGGPDPDMIWNFMARGQDSINLNDPQHARTKQRMLERGQAIPPNGILTKDQFRANFQQQMAQGGMGGRFGGDRSMRFGGGPGGPGGPTPGAPTVMTFTAGPDGKPVMMSGPPGTTPPVVMGGQPGMGMTPGAGPSPEMLSGIFQRYDRNGDGRITQDEATDRLRQSWTQYDRNGDGALDLSEYTGYIQERMVSRGRDGGDGRDSRGPGGFDPNNPQGGWNGMQGGWNNGQFGPQSGPGGSDRSTRPEEEIQRPVVYRYGKLPKEVPSWFESLDTDKDGMVGLYEWRRDSRKIADFTSMDLNEDGYLTADEWLRYNKLTIEKKPSGSEENARPSRGDRATPPGPGRDGPGASGTERSGPGRGGAFRRPGGGGPGGGNGGDRGMSRPPDRGGDRGSRGGDRGGEPRRPNPFTGR